MSNPQETNGKYLWWHLQSLEFHIDVANSAGTKTNIKHLNLGMTMFDKPNKEAFYIVIHFLFKKLNPTHAQDVFRNCWPVLNHKADVEFRKVAVGWLQEIANEEGSGFPKVLYSHLLSPSGPKFIKMMLHLAQHVMLKMMKTFTTDGSWVPEAAVVPASCPELEMKRFQMVKRHFQRVSVGQDSLIQDYQKRARGLQKCLKDLNAEDAKYNDVLKKYDDSKDLEKDLLTKIYKVRSLWAEIDKTLSGLEGEQHVLNSVMKGEVDQFVLDGKDISLNIPAVLLERMEKLSYQTKIGSLYEGGQPVLLRLFELLNVGLSLLSEERSKISEPTSQLDHQRLQEQALVMKRSKETLKNLRRKLAKEDIPQTKSSIKNLERDWELKWAECLRDTPLISFLNQDPVLDFVSPMPPLSFEPATEASFKASIFSQYPAKLPELVGKTTRESTYLTGKEISTYADIPSSLIHEDKTEGLLFSSFASPRPVSPFAVRPETPVSLLDTPAIALTPCSAQANQRRLPNSQTKKSVLKPKSTILELEYDNLASQFADAVTMSPVDDRRSGMELEYLLNTLSDPFTTKKQLPRTPESLTMDVGTSWRKAVEEEKVEKKKKKSDSLICLKTPVSELKEENASIEMNFPNGPSASADPQLCGHAPFLKGASFHSTVIWDSSQHEAVSQNSSDIIHFSIAQETFPGLENDASFNGSDSPKESQNEMEQLLLPPIITFSPDNETGLQTVRRHLVSLNESPFTGGYKETKSDFMPLTKINSPGLSSCSGEKLFSLDLDQLENSSLQEDLTLPNLVTFSPIDEL